MVNNTGVYLMKRWRGRVLYKIITFNLTEDVVKEEIVLFLKCLGRILIQSSSFSDAYYW